MYVQDTIVAPASPPGRGAVAIVRLSGPRAIAILREVWRPERRGELKARRLYLGEIRDPLTGAAIDRALAVIMPTPRSLTGEDVAELHCHGGPFLVRRVLGLALARGARMAEPGEFSRRALLNGRIDLSAAEAVADLIAAGSEGALQQALGQLSGALAQRVGRLRGELIAVRAHLEAEIDFSDEDLRLPSRGEVAAEIWRLRGEIGVLHDSFTRGRLTRDGVRAAILGKPNAGKSSILNLLLGVDRAIVTALPGTTRDVIEEALELGPWRLVIQDTAGLRESHDEVERIGVERALRQAREADLLIAVFDGSTALGADDRRVIEACRGRPGLAILNKQDLPPALGAETLRQAGAELPVLPLCALRAEQAGALRDELSRVVEALTVPAQGEGLAISRERHRQALARALAALAAAEAGALQGMPPEIVAVEVSLAAEALGAITGEVTSEEVLDAVFREFCIGK